jgi:hypothetical protein
MDLEWAAHTGDHIVAHWQAVLCSHPHCSYRQLCTGIGPLFGYDPSFVPVPVPVRNSLILFLPLFSDWMPLMLFLVAHPQSKPQSTAALLTTTHHALMLVIGQVRQHY